MSYRGANWVHQPSDFRTVGSLANGIKPDLVILYLTIPRETVEQILEPAPSRTSVSNVIILLGPKGIYYATAEGPSGHEEAYNVEMVDSTRGGDAFLGCYAADYVRQKAQGEWNIQQAVQRAHRALACTISRIGAQTSIPWADEIDALE
ncbi:uncharacterized protein Z518_08767 [Rhinocladiella mackenziei CBS 650.93]|uniref:Carbohydrate kinase PfkB domain-containing protein n=1 Tax=Rhinocladiella mackenziei CBS 650.93 TaxID=1442369 RepID=A0A0D2IAD5_9EURO|nr:uncharacterized protein Z518_08767 [Rhinocladiella mackenziei CBS 650.93]KIX02824.1 hypothetical protein Z518_08767 [Rhinocladiella mackenziei CBS 650.93]